MIAAILLAAGASRRFAADASNSGGAGKLVQDLNGAPVLSWSAAAFTDPRITELVVVVPPGRAEVARALAGRSAKIVVNPDASSGIGRSIAIGVSAVQHARAALIGLGDEPFTSRDVTASVIDRYLDGGVHIVAPRFDGVIGHPVLFDHAVFPELMALDGDRGARSIVTRDAKRVLYVDVPAPPPLDVDTRDDLALARVRAQNMSPPRHPNR